jgi:hypothetical protein
VNLFEKGRKVEDVGVMKDEELCGLPRDIPSVINVTYISLVTDST